MGRLLWAVLGDCLPCCLLFTIYATLRFVDLPLPVSEIPAESLARSIARSNRTWQWCPFNVKPEFLPCEHVTTSLPAGSIPVLMRADDEELDDERQLVVIGLDSLEFIDEKVDYLLAEAERLAASPQFGLVVIHWLHDQLRSGWVDELLTALLPHEKDPSKTPHFIYVITLLVTVATWNAIRNTDSLSIGHGREAGKRRVRLSLIVMSLMFAPSDLHHSSPSPTLTRTQRLYAGNVADELLFLHALLLCGTIECLAGAAMRRFEASVKAHEVCAGESAVVEQRFKLLTFLATALLSMVASLAALVLFIADYEHVLSADYKAVLAMRSLSPFLHSWLLALKVLRYASVGPSTELSADRPRALRRLESVIHRLDGVFTALILFLAIIYGLFQHDRVLLSLITFPHLRRVIFANEA